MFKLLEVMSHIEKVFHPSIPSKTKYSYAKLHLKKLQRIMRIKLFNIKLARDDDY